MATLYALPSVLLGLLFRVQFLYAEALSVERSLSQYDLTFPARGDRELNATVKFVAVFCFAYMGLALARQVTTYAIDEDAAPRSRAGLCRAGVGWLFGLANTLMIVLFLTYCTVACCWILVAAVMKPTEYLKYAAAAAVLIFVITTTHKQLAASAQKMIDLVQGIFDKTLQKSLENARHKLRDRALETAKNDQVRRRATAGAMGAAASPRSPRSAAGADPEAPKEKDFDFSQIFDLIDEDESNALTKAELHDLFVMMELNISDEQIENMFAYADADGSGEIELHEFKEAWGMIESQMLMTVIEQVGLTKSQILGAVIAVAATVVTLFAFIFLAIGAWNDADGAFGAVVESVFIAGSGFVAQVASKPKPGEAEDTRKAEQISKTILKPPGKA